MTQSVVRSPLENDAKKPLRSFDDEKSARHKTEGSSGDVIGLTVIGLRHATSRDVICDASFQTVVIINYAHFCPGLQAGVTPAMSA